MAVQTQIQTRRGTAASWTSTNPTLAAGEIGFETDTGKFKIGNGSTAWASLAYSAGATAVTYLFNATGGQTTFSGADANGLTLAYTVGAEQVYLNGVLQVRGSDYTATNGTSIVLTSGALVSDVLNVIAYSAMTITDTYTQAQADAKFFQNANAFVAGKNKIINGDFAINQRAFTSNTTTNTYNFDRWAQFNSGGTFTVTPQTFTPGTAPVAGYEAANFLRGVTASQSAASDFASFSQKIEDVRTFAGQTVTISFWAKAGSGTPAISVEAIQNFGTGGSPSATVTGSVAAGTVAKKTISTSWARYSATLTIPSISGKTIGTDTNSSFLQFGLFVSAGSDRATRTDSLGIQNGTFDIWGVQAEAGSIATAFQTATGTIQGELAACQRYFSRFISGASKVGAMATASSTTSAFFAIPLIVEMRSAPSLTVSSASHFGYSGIAVNNAITLDGTRTTSKVALIDATIASASLVARSGYLFVSDSASATFDLSAEL